ncbi:hypothetical protein ALC60_00559 [Trachymyrmex zeteki]|uniref:Uncharacterized protein n=1 Tax=Mycetomoellerius zeteki TaxID=64791 RepID=A0A151XIB2_9HYME|nr:hypothetical protein ALC60_00559 [Trachymyrmex zeteki]
MEEKEKTEHENLSRVPIKRSSRMMYDSARSHQVTVTCCLPKQALPIDTTRLCWQSHRQPGDLVNCSGLPIHNAHFLPDSNINRQMDSSAHSKTSDNTKAKLTSGHFVELNDSHHYQFQPSASDSCSNNNLVQVEMRLDTDADARGKGRTEEPRDTPLLYVYPPLRIHPRPPMLLAIMVRSHGDKAPVTIGGRQAGPVLAPRACSSVRSLFLLS